MKSYFKQVEKVALGLLGLEEGSWALLNDPSDVICPLETVGKLALSSVAGLSFRIENLGAGFPNSNPVIGKDQSRLDTVTGSD